MDTRTSAARLNIERIRAVLEANGCAAALIPSSDPHLSEYLPERWQGRQWASGFTGSVATLALTLERAALFVDSRYWVQAERELAGSGIELVKTPSPVASFHIEWLCRNVAAGGTVAVDGDVLGLGAARQLQAELERCGIALRSDLDVLAAAWPERPATPTAAVYEHARPEAPNRAPSGSPRPLRRCARRARRTTSSPPSTTSPGSSTCAAPTSATTRSSSPTCSSRPTGDALHRRAKVDARLAATLAADGVRIAPYEAAGAALAALPEDATLLLDPKRVTLGTRERVRARVVEAIQSEHARQEPQERRRGGARAPGDGRGRRGDVRVLRLVRGGARRPRAARLAHRADDRRKLTEARAKRPGYVGPSFATIAAFNANGAMPHYRATPRVARLARRRRPAPDRLGRPVPRRHDRHHADVAGRRDHARARRDVTLVLRGTIALSRTRFPRGTLSPMLDTIARVPLWEHGLDYGHGTGHGVGYFLNVHEGPQSFSRVIPDATMAMQPA
jgi:Xaa-Pro aminopeptidase